MAVINHLEALVGSYGAVGGLWRDLTAWCGKGDLLLILLQIVAYC